MDMGIMRKYLVRLIIYSSVCALSSFGQQTEFHGRELFSISINGRLACIDKTGKIVFESDYLCYPFPEFSEGFSYIPIPPDCWAYIDTTGTVVMFIGFSPTGPPRLFHEGLAALSFYKETGKHKWGYMDKSGDMVIQPIFEEVGDFSENLAPVVIENKWGYINSLGDTVIMPHFDGARSFLNGLAAVNLSGTRNFYSLVGGKWGFIDKHGSIVIRPQFDCAGDFSEGLAPVMIDKKWGYIDRSGEITIESQFDCAGNFYNGLAPVNINGDDLYIYYTARGYRIKGGKWGYINTKGHFRIQPQFDNATDFSKGLAKVDLGGEWGYIDTTGEYIWKPTK